MQQRNVIAIEVQCPECGETHVRPWAVYDGLPEDVEGTCPPEDEFLSHDIAGCGETVEFDVLDVRTEDEED